MVRYSSKFLYRPMFKADLPHPPHVPDHNSFYTAPRSRWVPHYLVFSDKPIRFLYRPTPKVGRVFIEQAAVCKFLYRPTPKVGRAGESPRSGRRRFLYRPTPKVGRAGENPRSGRRRFQYRPTPKVGQAVYLAVAGFRGFYTDPRLRWVFTPSHISKTW